MDKIPWFVDQINADTFVVGGDIDNDNVDGFCLALQKLPTHICFDCSELEIEDGPAMAVIVSALRLLVPCTLIEAPRMLAHTLYKIDAGNITLVRPRSY